LFSDGNRVAIKKLPDTWAVLVATPIMIRAQALSSASEIIFIDSTSTCDATHSYVTILLTATKVGAIPLSVIIHESTTAYSYKEAFTLLKENFPKCFGGKEVRKIFSICMNFQQACCNQIFSFLIAVPRSFHDRQLSSRKRSTARDLE
jgi:hypothetical protein